MTFYSTMKNCIVKLMTTFFRMWTIPFQLSIVLQDPNQGIRAFGHCAQLPLGPPSMEAIEFSIVGGSPISNFSDPVISFEN